MKIKKFQARTTKEALDQVKKTLGPDALILSVKKCGLLNKYVEVTAAVDSPGEVVDFEREEFNPAHELSLIQDQIRELKEIIKSLIPSGSLGNGVLPFFQQVRKRGISEEIALRFVEALEEGILKEGLDKGMTLKDFLYELLCRLIEVYPPIQKTDKRIALFIGPTGSGKSTTLAKLAGMLAKEFKVGIISIDDRESGSLIMEYYADLLEIPFSRTTASSQLTKQIGSYSDKDFILIDTAGINVRDEYSLQRLISQIRSLNNGLITYMVLDVRMKEEEILKIMQKIKPIEVSALIFTRIDEADVLGTMFNQMIYTSKPLAYIGTGTSVPDDIEPVTPYRLVDLIINLNKGEEYEYVKGSKEIR